MRLWLESTGQIGLVMLFCVEDKERTTRGYEGNAVRSDHYILITFPMTTSTIVKISDKAHFACSVSVDQQYAPPHD